MKSKKPFILLFSLLLVCSIWAKAGHSGTNVSTEYPFKSHSIEEYDPRSVAEEQDLSEQLSIMMGHLRAGLALFEVAEHAMGTPHLMHPIRETSEGQRNVLKSYGFDEKQFEFLADSIEIESPNLPVMAEVLSLISSMESLQTRLASDSFRNILTLLNLAVEEYQIAVKGDVISDVSEYQDSYGFILEAKKQSARLKTVEASAALSILGSLELLWINGVLPPSKPTSTSKVAKRIGDAIEELRELQDVSAK